MAKVEPLEAELLTPSQVAALFKVDPKTVGRWAKAGKLACIRTSVGTAATRPTRSGRCWPARP
jgi:predicted site-specific integrase-resolvase